MAFAHLAALREADRIHAKRERDGRTMQALARALIVTINRPAETMLKLERGT